MDYEKEEQAFYSRLEADPLSAAAIALWHALRVISKVVGRTEGLSISQGMLCAKAGLTPKNLERGRNQLTAKGLVEWKARGKDKATVYTFKSVIRQNEPQIVAYSVAEPVANNVVEPVMESVVEKGALYNPILSNVYGDIRRQKEPQNVACSVAESVACSVAYTPKPFLRDSEVFGLQAALDAVERLARDIGMNYSDFGTINRLAADYTAPWCMQALERARLNAKGIPSWKYVESILKRWREGGGIDAESKPLQPLADESHEADEARLRAQERSERILRGEYD